MNAYSIVSALSMKSQSKCCLAWGVLYGKNSNSDVLVCRLGITTSVE